MPTTQRNNIVALKLNEYDVTTICVVDTLTNYSPNKGLSLPVLTYAYGCPHTKSSWAGRQAG